jgi:predicted DNA-binding ribbon-helix-helix protein
MKPKRQSRQPQSSSIVKRTAVVAGRKTSVSLEDAFWDALREIAATRNKRVSELISMIDQEGQHANLSSAIRLFVLGHYLAQRNRRRSTNPTLRGPARR